MDKFIFLDIDGVLNCSTTTQYIHLFVGIDPQKCQILKQIVDLTGGKIILCSSWKSEWDRDPEKCTEYGTYLQQNFDDAGLVIHDITKDAGRDRGRGILRYLYAHPCDGFIVLDDEFFADYKQCNIVPHWLHTYDGDGGLLERHIELACQLMKVPVVLPDRQAMTDRPTIELDELYDYNDGKYDNKLLV